MIMFSVYHGCRSDVTPDLVRLRHRAEAGQARPGPGHNGVRVRLGGSASGAVGPAKADSDVVVVDSPGHRIDATATSIVDTR